MWVSYESGFMRSHICGFHINAQRSWSSQSKGFFFLKKKNTRVTFISLWSLLMELEKHLCWDLDDFSQAFNVALQVLEKSLQVFANLIECFVNSSKNINNSRLFSLNSFRFMFSRWIWKTLQRHVVSLMKCDVIADESRVESEMSRFQLLIRLTYILTYIFQVCIYWAFELGKRLSHAGSVTEWC